MALPGIPRPPVMHICNKTKLAEFSKIQVDVFFYKKYGKKIAVGLDETLKQIHLPYERLIPEMTRSNGS